MIFAIPTQGVWQVWAVPKLKTFRLWEIKENPRIHRKQLSFWPGVSKNLGKIKHKLCFHVALVSAKDLSTPQAIAHLVKTTIHQSGKKPVESAQEAYRTNISYKQEAFSEARGITLENNQQQTIDDSPQKDRNNIPKKTIKRKRTPKNPPQNKS